MVESALALVFGTLMIVGGIDMLRISYVTVAGQYVLCETARWSTIGTTLPGLTRTESIKQILRDRAAVFGLQTTDANIRICAIDDINCTIDDPQGSGKEVYLAAKFPIRFLVAKYTLDYEVGTFAKNEPFS